ncbi:MAG: YdjY domain-containing protein [Planctomycetota bacterium]|jgi:hypothetical protein
MTKLIASLQVLMLALLVVMFLIIDSRTGALRREVESLRADAAREIPGERTPPDRKELAAIQARLGRLEVKSQDVLDAMEFLAVDIDGIKRNTWEALQTVKAMRGNVEPEMPEDYKRLFEPETREALLKLASEKGVRLLEDRVEVDGVIIQQRAMLEFFAVISGGKEHESVVAVTGSYERDGERRPEKLGATINACILALGYERGSPVSVTPDGKVIPPKGTPIHIYVEWKDEKGETVRARAEDLVYNIDKERPMARDRWVYVGSRFEQNPMSGEAIYLADLTGDLVATYSWPNTIVDNTTSEAQDDIYYVCFTPRIPEVGTKVVLVFSKEPLPAKDFPEEEPVKDEGGSGK